MTTFNSATAVKPWRTTARSLAASADRARLQFGHGGEAVENERYGGKVNVDDGLQFGHGGEAVENSDAQIAGCVGVATFNSATAVKPWRTGLQRHMSIAIDRPFNSATAVKPWRTPTEIPLSPTKTGTSIRPRR